MSANELRDKRTDLLNIRGILSPQGRSLGLPPVVPMPLGEEVAPAVEWLANEADRLREERDQLRAHILDIDAHATPYEDLPDDPGYVGLYLLTSGALHRALGKVGHTAAPCQDARKVAELQEKLEDAERTQRSAEAANERARRIAQVWVDIRPDYPTATREGHVIADAGQQILDALGGES